MTEDKYSILQVGITSKGYVCYVGSYDMRAAYKARNGLLFLGMISFDTPLQLAIF